MKIKIYTILFLNLIFVFVSEAIPPLSIKSESSMTGSDEKKGYVGVFGAISFAQADFASTDIYATSVGFAQTGFALGISGGYKFLGNLGACALVQEQINPVDVGSLTTGFYIQNPNFLWSVTVEDWKQFAYLGGIYFSLPFDASNKASFTIRAMAGNTTVTSPNYFVSASNGSSSAWVNINSNDANAFCYLGGLGFNFNIIKALSVSINADYWASKPKWENTATVYSNNDVTFSSDELNVSSLNMSLGFSFNF